MRTHTHTHSFVFPVLLGVLAYFTGALVWAGATLRDVQHECTSKLYKLGTFPQGNAC